MIFTWCSLRQAFFISLVVVSMKLLPSVDCNVDVGSLQGYGSGNLSDPGAGPTPVKPHRCYWCGPLAFQPDRSRTSLPCDEQIEPYIILCGTGYGYCAVAYSGPPFVMSKLCVNKYHDDCITSFCNVSNTWRTVCPCKGEICNSPIGDRELTALENVKVQYKQAQTTTATTIVLETSISVMVSSTEKQLQAQQRIVNDDESNKELDKIGSSVSSFMNQFPVNMPKDEQDITIPTIGKPDLAKAIVTEKPSITDVKPTSMPPVESLHENVTPTTMNNAEKVAITTVMATQPETTETIVTIDKSREENRVATTAKPKKAKNLSSQLSASISVFISCLVVYKTSLI